MVRKSLVCITLGVLASLAWAGGEPLQCLGPVRALEHEAFLVSPRFSGDGQSLRVKGRGGKGDYLLRLPDASLTPLAPQSTEISLDGQGWQVMGDFRHRVYDGRLEFGEPGRWRVLEAAGVWGPRLSPDGNTLAYNTGLLSRARLWLAEGEDLRGLGAGAHQRWLPDSAGLIFAVPEARPDGRGLAGSRLALWLRDEGTLHWLTSEGSCPMQPALSLDGTTLAWSDWHSGRIFVARLNLRAVQP